MLKKIQLQYVYFILVFICYFLQVFFDAARPGYFSAGLMLLVILQIVIIDFYVDKRHIKNELLNISLLDTVVSVYFIYNILSVIWLTKYGLPVSVYAGEFVSSILPIIFYYVAISNNSNRESFYKSFMYGMLFLGIVSLVLYIVAPQFYCDYLFRMNYISKADAQTTRVRMESITGSTCFSFLTIAGMIVSAYSVIQSIKDNRTDVNKKVNIISSACFFVFCIALVFLANSRAGMVTAMLVIVYLNVLLVFTFKIINKKYFYIEVAVFIVAIVALCIITPGAVGKIAARLISLPGAVGQRSEQWVAAMNNMHGAWLGNGLGANGHRALYINQDVHVVADGGLVKLFCEEGCVGFGLFAYIIATVLSKGFKNLRECYSEVAIIAVIFLMSIGANVIAFQLCCPIMWYAIGYISKNTRNEKDLFLYSVKNRKAGDK